MQTSCLLYDLMMKFTAVCSVVLLLISQDINGRSTVNFRSFAFCQNKSVLPKSFMVRMSTKEKLCMIKNERKLFRLSENCLSLVLVVFSMFV